jgi:hypothetical protein
MDQDTPSTTLIAGLGDPRHEDSRFLGLRDRRPILPYGKDRELAAPQPLNATGWHLLAAIFDGTSAHLFVDGAEVAVEIPPFSRVDTLLTIAPNQTLADVPFTHFGGLVAQVTLTPRGLEPRRHP